jgi:hypothetical protein
MARRVVLGMAGAMERRTVRTRLFTGGPLSATETTECPVIYQPDWLWKLHKVNREAQCNYWDSAV